MTGPGGGHNVKRFFRWFEEHSGEYQLTYHPYNRPGHYDLADYPSIEILPRFNPLKLVQAIRRAEVIWIHNWTPVPVLRLISIYKRRKAVVNFNFWSEKLPRAVFRKQGAHKFYRLFWQQCDILQCTWYGVKDWLDKIGCARVEMLRWGLEREYFENLANHLPTAFTRQFIQNLPHDRFKFFFPKTIGFPNRHDLIVEVAERLRTDGFQFVVYFWVGNRKDRAYFQQLQKLISEKNLSEVVRIVEHPFLPNLDIASIWRVMDAGLQICDQDQLSTSFTEPQLFKKPIVASAINSYQRFNREFKVQIPLVENNVDALAEAMANAMTQAIPDSELEQRSANIKEHFQFEKNMLNIMTRLSKLRELKKS